MSDAPGTAEQIAESIVRQQFPTSVRGARYDADAADDALDEILVTLREQGPGAAASSLATLRLPAARWLRQGYRADAVDEFLTDLAARLSAL